jgi:hypothetical protein
MFGWVWSDWRAGLTVAVMCVTVFVLLNAWWTPRGPVTTSEALITMAAALCVGLGAGLATGNRWSLLLAPVVYMIVFELARLGASGPTIDAIHLDSTLGIVAFIVGRVAHGVLALVPMAAGALYGVWINGHWTQSISGVVGDAGVVAALAALAAWGLIPAAVGVGIVRRRDVV